MSVAHAETAANPLVCYQQSLTSRLRYEQAQHNLEKLHYFHPPLRVLDAAGGNGLNTSYLLGKGHAVTLLDSDPEKLRQANQLLAEAIRRRQCRLVLGKMDTIGEQLAGEQFDLILCHHVVEHLEDCAGTLNALQRLSAPNGELSLITLNPVSEVIRAVILKNDPAIARSKLRDKNHCLRRLGQTRLYTLEDITSAAEKADWCLENFMAIRVLADYMPEAEATEPRVLELIALEEELAMQEPYRRFGRFTQFCFKTRRVV
jgi:S-adenosylmethionine-dependent methyltransferase